MFAQANMVTTESPNGCPRILSSGTHKDFTTLLKTIHFPGFFSLPTCRKIASLITHLPPDSLNGITSRISSHSRPSSESRQSMRCRPSDLSYSRSFVIPIPRLEYEWLGPSKQIGKSIFSGQAPHPNEVPSLFVEQKITSALPMAYYIAA